MMTTNRQEVESDYDLFIFLKGMGIAFRKANGFFCLPYKLVVLSGAMPVKSLLCSREREQPQIPFSWWEKHKMSPSEAAGPQET